MSGTHPKAIQGRISGHPPQSSIAIRDGLHARTIYFPSGFLTRVETRPGALVELITLALDAYQRNGGAN